ncbi:MAG TPA: DUF2235 domain-containing protein [Gemmatimonas sp.]|nr:DUF2235 domain-containing protein [Gemmatimonas sp.]
MRRLIVCADGTWNKPQPNANGGLTNVALISTNIPQMTSNETEQVVAYFEGVGTGDWWDRWTGGAFGTGISVNIKKVYGFLMRNFRPGDELFLFGFSRGAYTVRSVAGMVRKCGIPRRLESGALSGRELELIDEAYDFYRQRGPETHPNSPAAVAFRHGRAHETPIKCLGVWDTIGSLGVPTSGPVGWISRRRHSFHDVKLSSRVHNAFHALAIDERRKPFKPSLWEIAHGDPARTSGTWRVEQRWFAGVHSNVGGGYADRGLSNIALRWMVDRAASCGMEFDAKFVADVHSGCDCTAEQFDSMNLFYKLMGNGEREIETPRVDPKSGEPMHTYEEIDNTAAERCHSPRLGGRYRPQNFLRAWSVRPDRFPEFTLPR